jgi:hypothetical protein
VLFEEIAASFAPQDKLKSIIANDFEIISAANLIWAHALLE